MAQARRSFARIKGSIQLFSARRCSRRHNLKLQPRDTIARLGEFIPEVVQLNSHDRSSGYQLHAGLFRFVRANDLMVADSLIASVRTQHTGGKEFKKRMLQRAGGQLGEHDCGNCSARARKAKPSPLKGRR
jgi:hypothetical protein